MKRIMSGLVAFLRYFRTGQSAYVQGRKWKTLNNEAVSLYRRGHYDRAVVVAKQALQVAERAVSSDRLDLAGGANNIAALVGPDHSNVATSLNILALLYNTQGQHGEAEPLYKRALAIYEKAFGPNHPNVATSLNNLAALYIDQGQYAQAEQLFKRSLAIIENALGPDHPNVAGSLTNLSVLYYTQGQYAQAEPLSKRALAIYEKAFGPNHPNVATSVENMALLYKKSGREKDAEALEKRAAAIRAIQR